MWIFSEDLTKWLVAEGKVLSVLSWEFNLVKNPNDRWIDLLIIDWWIEVKLDEYAQFSWNFYVEFECNNKPSWLFKEEEYRLKYWAHTDGIRVYLLIADDFKEFVSEKILNCRDNKSNTSKWFRVVEQWWNWWRTKGLLIPAKEMEQIAYKIYEYK